MPFLLLSHNKMTFHLFKNPLYPSNESNKWCDNKDTYLSTSDTLNRFKACNNTVNDFGAVKPNHKPTKIVALHSPLSHYQQIKCYSSSKA